MELCQRTHFPITPTFFYTFMLSRFTPYSALTLYQYLIVSFYEASSLGIALVGRVAEVAREHRWHPEKSLESDQHTLFCRELRFVAINALFGDLWAKKCLFGSKTVQEVHYYMVYSAYFTELNWKICDYAQK